MIRSTCTLRRSRSAKGFTLLEILVVLALLGLILGALGWGSALVVRPGRTSPDEVFWEALRRAREHALLQGVKVELFPPSNRTGEAPQLTLRAGVDRLASFPVVLGPESSIRFLGTSNPRNVTLVGGQVVSGDTLTRVTFFPDGTCVPFSFELRQGRSIQLIAIDPWTCAPLLPPPGGPRP